MALVSCTALPASRISDESTFQEKNAPDLTDKNDCTVCEARDLILTTNQRYPEVRLCSGSQGLRSACEPFSRRSQPESEVSHTPTESESVSATVSFCRRQHQYAAPPSFLSTAPVGPNSPLIKELSSTNFKSRLTRSQTCAGDLNFSDIGLQVAPKEIICQRKQNLLSFYHTPSRSKFDDYDPDPCLECGDLGADHEVFAESNIDTTNVTDPLFENFYDTLFEKVPEAEVSSIPFLGKFSSNGRIRTRRASMPEKHDVPCDMSHSSDTRNLRSPSATSHGCALAPKSKESLKIAAQAHQLACSGAGGSLRNLFSNSTLLPRKLVSAPPDSSTYTKLLPKTLSESTCSYSESFAQQSLSPSYSESITRQSLSPTYEFLQLASSEARLSPPAVSLAPSEDFSPPQSLDYCKMMPWHGKKFKHFYFLVSQAWLAALVLLSSVIVPGAWGSQYGDAEHITAILGEAVVLNCPVSQPDTPYIIQWKRQHHKIPIYIWYDGYDPHVEEAYKGRASRVNPDTTLGLASLNLTAVKEDDQGWYECKVFYLDRTGATDNGTWIHLDVHAPPRFTTTPDDVTYVNIGDSIILNCEAEGTPKPEIFWFRDDDPVTPSESVGIFNDGTELRINKIRDQDIGDYLCVARNAEGRVHHEAKVVIAGGAVIITPPMNMTRQEGEKAEFPCEAKALPGNVTVTWKREDVPINRLSWLDTRSILRHDGTLVINPTSADDGGFFTCEVSNGIGTPQRATAYLNVEYPARVTYTPTVQYLPFRQQGIVKCHIKANPEVQFVTWIKDKRLFEPDNEDGVVKLKNGSLLFTKVNQSYQGRYSCTPYNKHTTAGSSGDMEVLVREPPEFAPRPQPQYHGQQGEEVTLVCGGAGSPTPTVTWRRRDGLNLPRDRTTIHGGNLTIKSLLKSDHAFYECEVKNEILVIVASTQVLVEGTTPHPPYNITTKTSSFSVELSWLPGYPGGRDWDQKYTIWYRTLGSTTWSQIEVKPPGSTTVAIHNLTPGSTYEFQVQGKNELGDGMFSDIITATTEEYDPWQMIVLPTDSSGITYYPTIINPKGPKPAPPRNVTIKPKGGGYVITWRPPVGSVPIANYDIQHMIDNGDWKKLNDDKIVNATSYPVHKLTPGMKHKFRVVAKTLTSFQVSEEVELIIGELDQRKAVIAAVVGGMLLCIVAIILSVFTVKICNKRKRKKQEKAYNMVACRVSETRNGGYRGSAVPLKKLLRCRISSVKEFRVWLAELLLGEELLDTTDGKTLRSRTSVDSDSYRRYGVEHKRKFPKDVRYSVHAEYRQSPLPEISRSDEGKFILDKDSEEGGFTSPRRPTRGLRGHRNFREWTSPPEAGWTNAVSGVESGVYRVRQGTTHYHSVAPEPPLLTLRSDGSGASTYELPRNTFRSPVIYENSLVARDSHRSPYVVQPSSPQFGQHIIPQSPTGPVLSPKGRLRSSSPGPLSTQWRQLAQLASFNEVSSVKQPSSVERSFPSTLISSFHNSNQLTPSMRGFSGDGISPFFQFPSYSPYGKELPVLSPLYRYPDSRTLHVVGAQVHEPPPRFRSRPTYHPYYLPTPRYSPWGTPQGAFYDRRFDWMSPHQAEMMRRRAVLDSGQHVHQLPQHRIISPYNRALDSARHYANLPPMRSPRGFQQQHFPSRVPQFLLNPLPRPENQKPLATSSPPRLRLRNRGYERDLHPSDHAVSRLPRVVPDYENRNLPGDRGTKGLIPTMGEHAESRRHQGGGRIRHHSAPDLNTSSRDFKDHPSRSRLHHGRPRRHGDRSRSHEVSYDLSPEFSHDQSPDSSSGFGSKNTSQQQSSSQSGQSLAALGLDTSRFSENSIKAFGPTDPRWESRQLGIGAQIWPPPRLPPSYEQWLARQMQPQFRVPSGHYSYAIGDENRDFLLSRRTNTSVIPRHTMRDVAHSHPNVNELENDVFDSVDQVDRTAATTTATPVATLDVSVDDHYEFDTMLSPTPIDETLMPGSSEWSSVGSAGNGNSLRRLSDSELYGTGSSFGDRRRMSQESMEERVAAMKQEFMEYRRRQARRSETQLESVC